MTDRRQIEELHLYPADQAEQLAMDLTLDNRLVERLDVRHVLRQATRLRAALADEVDNTDPQRSARAKEHQLARVHEVTATLRRVADGIVAAGLPLGGKRGKKLNEAFENLRRAVEAAYPSDDSTHDDTWLDRLLDEGLAPTVETDYAHWIPLHWVIEVPDVMEPGGFDAIVGNPPFLGGKKISGASGTDVREWLVNVIADGTTGNADLVAYFFLRAVALLNTRGTLGLIATNTVAQGDTREVGLDRMVGAGFTITRAIQSRAWPAASANLEYAAVWGTVAPVAEEAPRIVDDVSVRRIATLLEPAGRVDGPPIRLAENVGKAFIGSLINGVGFTMPPSDAQRMIELDSRNAEVLAPYLNGEDLNTSPSGDASRWVVDFGMMTRDQAGTYHAPFKWVEENVRPYREAMAHKPRNQKLWWRYESPGLAMRRAIRDLDEMLLITRVSRTVMPLRVLTGQVPSDATVVFASDSWELQALLSSAFHQLWAVKYSSGMRNDPRYGPSDVFETFPQAGGTERMTWIGRVLDEDRREIMLRRQLGLTKLYNLVNDPEHQGDADIDRMRQIHVEVDEAVLAAYGWEDVPLNHGFHTYRQMRRWTICPEARVEILDRLLEENHRRAALQGDAAPLPSEADDLVDGAAEEES